MFNHGSYYCCDSTFVVVIKYFKVVPAEDKFKYKLITKMFINYVMHHSSFSQKIVK